MSRLFLFDGTAVAYRSHFAMMRSGLSTADGRPTGAVYGFTMALRRILREEKPDLVAVALDAKGPTFRHEKYAEYKATRERAPEEMIQQLEDIRTIILAHGIPIFEIPGYEADDVIGTLSTRAAEAGHEVRIVTGDKDMMQLVSDKVALHNIFKPGKDLVIEGPEEVEAKFGTTPDHVIDVLALMGDSSDNIPGVPKCGPKTAVKWLLEYQTLDNLVENSEKIGGKVGENLRNNLDVLAMSKDLATIRCDLSLDVVIDQLTLQSADTDTLIELYQELEFNSWLNELGASPADATASDVSEEIERHYELINTEQQLEAWLAKLKSAELFAFDTETTSLNTLQAKLVGMSFACVAGEAAYLPLAHTVGQIEQLDLAATLQKIKPLLEDSNVKKVGQNLKYDANVLKNYGIELNGIAYDTMLESYVLDSVNNRHDMDSLAQRYLNIKPISFESIAGKGKKQLTFDQIEIEQAAEYAAEDADITLRLHQVLVPKLAAEPSLQKVFDEIELPLLKVLAKVERNGVHIDSDMLFVQSQELAARLDEIECAAYEVAGGEFNLASPKQIQEILFERMQIPVLRKTPKGQPSTAEDVLQDLAVEHELPRLILEHRGLGKLKSTYADKLPTMIDRDTGRVHTSYHQAVAVTGRLSSSDPNLQNIPIRSAEGRRIRQAFVVDDGNHMLAADYSQVELRIMAHLSEDAALVSAFNQGADIHTATAAEILGVAAEQVETEDRRRAKAINFGLIYGMSAFGLAKQLGLSRGEAQDYIDLYFARYPGVKQYMDDIRESARELGYVETVFGRRLYLPDINGKNHQRKQYAERTAINAPMQGTAADLIKMAMIRLDQQLTEQNLASRMIMQVHDELVFEVPDDELTQIKGLVKDTMQNIATLKVPLIVDLGVGENWDKAH